MKDESRLPDPRLVALSKGDVSAFDSIFTGYFSKIRQFLSTFTTCPEEAEDLAQDVFIRLWQSRHLLANVQSLNGYLYQMARNTLYSYLETSLKKEAVPLDELSAFQDLNSLEEDILARELEDMIDLVVEKMPPQRKTIYLLSRKEGVKNEEIAERLQISKRTVETHISAALADIRKVMQSFYLFF